jgi:hypothetical protein
MSASASETATATARASASEMGASATKNDLIKKFNMYRNSHPNLSQCWIAYLGLKKRHYDAHLEGHCSRVLELLAKGHPDLKEPDLIRLLLYKHSV